MRHPLIRMLIVIVGFASLFGLAFATLFPDWAVAILEGNATTNSLLQVARGTGALLAAIMIATLGRFRGKGKLLTIGMMVFPVMLILFSFTRTLALSMLVLVGAGWSFMLIMNMSNTLVQVEVADELRGRVMALYSLMLSGGGPIGALVVGVAADRTSEPTVGLVCAGMLLLYGVTIWFIRPEMRKIA